MTKIGVLCLCGCGKLTKPGNIYIHGHCRRGKHLTDETKDKISRKAIESYKNNPRKGMSGKHHTQEARMKMRKKHRVNFPPPKFDDGQGNKLRLVLELTTAKLLQSRHVHYIYEKRLKLIDGFCFPDFTLDNNNIIEASGSAYKQWRKSLINKIQRIKQDYPTKKILITTYKEIVPLFPPFPNNVKILGVKSLSHPSS